VHLLRKRLGVGRAPQLVARFLDLQPLQLQLLGLQPNGPDDASKGQRRKQRVHKPKCIGKLGRFVQVAQQQERQHSDQQPQHDNSAKQTPRQFHDLLSQPVG
jgi:hypothetical protein